jgi:hypothetical protein
MVRKKKVVMMGRNVNCIFNDSGCWCFHTKRKKAFLFFGARMCVAFDNDEAFCPLRRKIPRPEIMPPKGGSGTKKPNK